MVLQVLQEKNTQEEGDKWWDSVLSVLRIQASKGSEAWNGASLKAPFIQAHALFGQRK